ncbi:MAG: hypothetical protein FWC38_04900 [Proteobacteria bacterium]|nr:hypothetical protein [Pseudomonadota bacterium]
MGVSGIRGQMSEVRGVGARFIAPCLASREAAKKDLTTKNTKATKKVVILRGAKRSRRIYPSPAWGRGVGERAMGVSGIRGQRSEVRGVGARFIAPCLYSREAAKKNSPLPQAGEG